MAVDLAVHLAALEELDRRQAQALLLHLGRLGREAARHHAADVRPVAGVLQPAEELAPIVEGQREAHVHQVRAAEVGIVDDVDVAGLGRAGLALADQADDLARRILHGADEHRQPELALADQRAGLLVVDAGRAVVGLGDHRREGRAREGDVHLVADLAEAGLDHRQRDGIDARSCRPPPTAIRRLPMSSTVAAAPGSITVVASICCTMAGPCDARADGQLHAIEDLRRLPARRRAKSLRSPMRAPSTLAARPPASISEAIGKRRPPADHRGDEVDQHRLDLRQAHLEAGEIGRLEQRLHLLARHVGVAEGRRGSGASGRGTACRRRAARRSRRSRSAPRR